MRNNLFSVTLKLSAIVVSQALLINSALAAMPGASGCSAEEADSLSDMFSCGSVSGSLRTLYYSTHNAYFVPGYSQDTVSYGGSVKYATAEYYGLSLRRKRYSPARYITQRRPPDYRTRPEPDRRGRSLCKLALSGLPHYGRRSAHQYSVYWRLRLAYYAHSVSWYRRKLWRRR